MQNYNPFVSNSIPVIVTPNSPNSNNNLNQETMVEAPQVVNPIGSSLNTTTVIPTAPNTVNDNPVVDSEDVAKRTSSKEKYAHLLTFHTKWGNEKIITLVGGKVKKNPEQALSFLNWVNTVEFDGNCLEKNEVLFVIKEKLSADLGITSTIQAAESLWNAMNMNPWAKRLNVKKGYTKNKLVYEWED